MDTRFRSERSAGSSCFFFWSLACQEKRQGANLHGVHHSIPQTPVVVHVEAHQPQDRNVEKNLPSRHHSSMLVEPSAPVFAVDRAKTKSASQNSERISPSKLVGEENPNIKG